MSVFTCNYGFSTGTYAGNPTGESISNLDTVSPKKIFKNLNEEKTILKTSGVSSFKQKDTVSPFQKMHIPTFGADRVKRL